MAKIYSLAANAAIPVTVKINRACHHLRENKRHLAPSYLQCGI
jgi:hypothetical protein